MWYRNLSCGFIGLKPLNTDNDVLELSKDVADQDVVDVYVEHIIDQDLVPIQYLHACEEIDI